jgi:hypothetical protein
MKTIPHRLLLCLAFHHFFVDSVQSDKTVFEGVLFSLETHLPQDCYAVLA